MGVISQTPPSLVCLLRGAMDLYDQWNENRKKIPAGEYLVKCVAGRRSEFWLQGKKGYGTSERFILMFEVIEGDFRGTILPMFLTTSENGKIPQGSYYYAFWSIANGNRKPLRGRLKEMPLSKFQNKVFRAQIVTVKPKWKTGEDEEKIEIEQPGHLHYSRVHLLCELMIGDPNA